MMDFAEMSIRDSLTALDRYGYTFFMCLNLSLTFDLI